MNTEEEPTASFGGIFLHSGVSLRISKLTLNLSDEGEITPDGPVIHLTYDLYPDWLRIACDQAAIARSTAATLDAVWPKGDPAEQHRIMGDEHRSSMLAIVASGAAFDAFYGMIQDQAPIDQTIRERWRAKKLSRAAQIAETIRQRFTIGQGSFRTLREFLDELLEFRGQAVHADRRYEAPRRHPRINVAVERRLALFTADNAHKAAGVTLSILAQLVEKPKAEFSELVKHCVNARKFVAPILQEWEARHGPLFERRDSDTADPIGS